MRVCNAWVVTGAIALAAAACGGGRATPTAPTEQPLPFLASPPVCTPPAGVRVHVLPVPGAATPVTVWIDGVAPAPGATVRAGDLYSVSHRRLTPAGFTSRVQIVVGDDTTRAVFASVSSGGCGSGSSFAPIPRTDQRLQVWLRIWVAPGEFRVGDPLPDLARPPDYQASEPLSWILVP